MTTRTSSARLPSFLGVRTLALFLAFFLVACDENEQGRVLRYEPGTYLGQADTPLSAEMRAELRHRAQRQGQ